MSPHDCTHLGHVWKETDGATYSRHRGRTQADVAVVCRHCPATATLKGRAQFSGARKGQPVDHTIPPAFKQVLDRALQEEPKPVPVRPVPKPT